MSTIECWLHELYKLLGPDVTFEELKSRLRGIVTVNGQETRNLITNAGIRKVITSLGRHQMISGGKFAPTFKIHKFAASTNDATPSALDVSLGGSESKRVIEQVDAIGDNLHCTAFIMRQEFNFSWKKIGLYTQDGVLFCVTLLTQTKTSDTSLAVQWAIGLEDGS